VQEKGLGRGGGHVDEPSEAGHDVLVGGYLVCDVLFQERENASRESGLHAFSWCVALWFL
jgi:hypothetical protein